MKTTALLILLTSTNLAFADNIIREEYDPKPMVEGNRRVDELIEWNKNHPGEMPPLTEQEKYEFFIKKGMPLPGTGATVVDNNKGFKMTKAQSEIVNKFNADQKTKGYYETVNKKAMRLLAMPEIAEKEYNLRKSMAYNPQDTHLYEVKNNLPMSYDYKGLAPSVAIKVIGYAPESIFVNNGWAGAVEFFVPSFGGVCAYHEISLKLTKTSAYIPKEIATFAINNKLTKMNVVGSHDTGFVYEVEWWDKNFRRTIECATTTFSEETRTDTIKLAQRIDSSFKD